MAKATPIEKLNKAIVDTVQKYATELGGNIEEAAIQLGKQGAKTLRATSPKGKTPRAKSYSAGWTSVTEKTRLHTGVVIYNKNKPGLAHPLEKGHRVVLHNGYIKRNGSRTFVDPRPHIEPVEEALINAFVKEVLEKV